jgi:tetratricopeptide (TPR) repeat protein
LNPACRQAGTDQILKSSVKNNRTANIFYSYQKENSRFGFTTTPTAMTKILLLALAIFFITPAFSQKDKKKSKNSDTTVLSGKAAEDLMKQLGMDSAYFLRTSATASCNCIDSVDKAEKDKKKKIDAFATCIDDQVVVYQMTSQLFKPKKDSEKPNVMSIAVDKESDVYKSHYFQIERWLMDSCNTLKQAISSNDEEREKSYSDNPDAMKAYNDGIEFLKKDKYAECIPYFEKAVSIDPEFAFAWDNLGICYRRTGKFDKAEAAYKASLKVDPQGKTALQNLAVVYQMQKRDDDAIAMYKEIVKYYPDDPEVYYGIGMVYYSNKKDWENALDNMCKAYNIYVAQKSPYRSDAEQVINLIFKEMKKENKEDKFNKILKDNNIRSN